MGHSEIAMGAGCTSRPAGRGGSRLLAAVAAAGMLLLAGCDSAEERAQAHLESAEELIAEDQTVKAVLELRNALKLDPELAPAHLALGKIREDEGKLGAALKHFRTVTEQDPTLYEGHLRYGRILLAGGQLDKALRASNAAYQLAPDKVRVLALRAAVNFRLDNTETARKALDAAFEADPKLPELYLIKAAMQRPNPEAGGEEVVRAGPDAGTVEQGEAPARTSAEIEARLETVEEGLAAAPDDLALLLARVALLAQLERMDEARAALAEAVERHPDQAALREQLVREQLRVGELAAAERNLRTLAEQQSGKAGRALDVARIVIRREGVEAGLSELDRRIEAAETPALAWQLTEAKASLLQQRGRADAAAAELSAAIEAFAGEPQAEEARVRLAEFRLGQGDRSGAEALITTVLEGDAANARALALRARLAIRDQNYDAAIADLRKAVTEDPDNVAVLQLLAVAHRRNGNREVAGERLADAVEASGQAPGPVLDYARYLVQSDKAAFAAQTVEDALAKNPNNRGLLEALAQIYLRMQDWVRAEEVGQRIAELDEGQGLSANVMAAAKAGQGDYESSIAALTGGEVPAASAQEMDGAAFERLFMMTLRADKLDEARSLLEERRAAQPEDPTAMRLEAALTAAQGDREAAISMLEQAIETAPDAAKSYLLLARLHGAAGEIQAARESLERGIERTDSSGLRMALATIEERTGDTQAAIELYRAVLARQPGFEVAANNLASLLSDHDPTSEELAEAHRVAKRLRGADLPQFQDTWGWIQHLRGDSKAALKTLETAAEGLPEHPIVQYHLGAVLADLGRTERARTVLSRAVELAGEASLPQIDKARALLDSLPEREGAADAE